ncbi:CCA tRNA nucleotidyltransferase [Asticcacaulis excentricus]|uniref:Polynucleotide adenylyltransferase region n=1 Tax=Asticcacaulis excentricus (strain ATCC 15261 / DSM 4724 / KCTC 12464 / NCIMB 9791 / VKM B-1370 / CB 48) TaxID=573065 RepID=E8RMJ3_ASTEC|nr:CCA tRNA nucleotidyltransferase [Asticcacaulis excentricus]ADU12813.1 Polynucleotide adenylyltransferase region [Asticcacaulis excentricus CB 48]
MHIALPPEMTAPAVQRVFAALEAAGGAGCVRFVGGCVRDVVMGRTPGDLDLSTQLTPDATEAALSAASIRHVPTGKAFGTITAVIDGQPFEITSLREDVETDGRRAVVSYTTDWSRDAQRRDLYLNALYADIRGEVFDPTGQGFDDARAARVRLIGDAETRIREDYLRILRFFRFSASHGTGLDAASLSACVALRAGIDSLSGERIQQELFKLLGIADPVNVVRRMTETGVMAHVVPGASVNAERVEAGFPLTSDPIQRLIILVGGQGWGETLTALILRLRLSSRMADRLSAAAVACAEVDITASLAALRRGLYRYGRHAISDGLVLRGAEAGLSPEAWKALDQNLKKIEVPVFPLKSARLISIGLAPGPELGQTLRRIEAEWIAHDFSPIVIEDAIDAITKQTNIRGQ